MRFRFFMFFCVECIKIAKNTEIRTNTCINRVIKDMPISAPDIKYFLSIKKYIATNAKNVDTISVSMIPSKKKNVGDKAKNIEDSKAVFSSNSLFPIR